MDLPFVFELDLNSLVCRFLLFGDVLGAMAYILGVVGLILTFLYGQESSSWNPMKPV